MTKENESVTLDTRENEIIELGVASSETQGINPLADEDGVGLGGRPAENRLTDD